MNMIEKVELWCCFPPEGREWWTQFLASIFVAEEPITRALLFGHFLFTFSHSTADIDDPPTIFQDLIPNSNVIFSPELES